jgi:hypothetical protein
MRGVYFIHDTEYCKIGFSTNIDNRLNGLKTGHPKKLFLSYKEKGGMELEKKYHKRFGEYRQRGEWFEIKGELYDFILEKNPQEIYNISQNIKKLRKEEKILINKLVKENSKLWSDLNIYKKKAEFFENELNKFKELSEKWYSNFEKKEGLYNRAEEILEEYKKLKNADPFYRNFYIKKTTPSKFTNFIDRITNYFNLKKAKRKNGG